MGCLVPPNTTRLRQRTIKGNPVTSGERTPLSAAVSKDDGKTWSKPRHLETDAGWAFSNPGCCFTSKGTVVVNYWACKYQPSGLMSNYPIHLKAALVDLKWLYEKE